MILQHHTSLRSFPEDIYMLDIMDSFHRFFMKTNTKQSKQFHVVYPG